jgi:hypothetical protein
MTILKVPKALKYLISLHLNISERSQKSRHTRDRLAGSGSWRSPIDLSLPHIERGPTHPMDQFCKSHAKFISHVFEYCGATFLCVRTLFICICEDFTLLFNEQTLLRLKAAEITILKSVQPTFQFQIFRGLNFLSNWALIKRR